MFFPNSFVIALLSLTTSVASHPNHQHHHQHAASHIEKRYALETSYTASNFFDGFTFFTGPDPTDGDVEYITQFEAYLLGYINTKNNQVYLGVDNTTVNPANGRLSVRVQSNQAYTHGLFIADIAHMPGSICGVWPSYWMFGPNFPDSGEIDIIENVNYVFTNQLTLHTSPGCTINIAGSAAGATLLDSNCNDNNGLDGCSVTTTNQNAYGNFFNINGGGVYATLWESTGIKIWFFERGSIPSDITADAPNPSGWGTPLVSFNGGSTCNIDSFFANNNIVFDIDFCGDWAGQLWDSSPCYSVFGGTCDEFVNANPSAFSQAYWLLNSLKVYQ
ncbi:glycoside hydrolase family 16 protein [Hyaloscypha variabilis]